MYRLITQPALQVRTRATNNTFHRSLHHLTPRPVAHRSSIHHRQTSLKKNHDVDHPMQKRGLIDWITSVNPLLLKVMTNE